MIPPSDFAFPTSHEKLLEKVIVYDNKILSSTYTPLNSGGYEITLQLEAHKMELQADGALTEVPMMEAVNIGLFQLHPDDLVWFSAKRGLILALRLNRPKIRQVSVISLEVPYT